MAKLKSRQRQIYEYIVSFTEENGYPPSVREIGEAVDLKSPSTVHFHMKHLEEAGLIVRAGKKTRAITLPQTFPLTKSERDLPLDRIPIVGSVAAGTPILAEECIEDYLIFETNGRTGEYFALQVRGESMLNAGILPGDLVVVHQQQDANSGEIVVAMFDGEATVKTLRRRDGHVWLMPENAGYDPIPGDCAEILGKVTAVVRRY